jgi:CelD/BcsL family acetyltransferase involved in cellulose biosynthesis
MIVPAGLEALYQGLSSKARKNQRWQAKRLMQDHSGQVEVRCFRREHELDEAIRQVEQIVEKTYHRALGIGFSDTPDMRERLGLQARRGWLRIHVLVVKGQPWAFWIGRLYQQTFHSDFMGYDPANAKYSPGMFLILKVIEGFSCGVGGERAEEIDFGFGDAQYKQVLGNREWNESPVYVFAPNLKGLRLHLLQMPSVVVDRFVRPLLERTDLAKRIKKMWRAWAIEREIHVPGPKAAGAGVGGE